jgi:hypothetical protein
VGGVRVAGSRPGTPLLRVHACPPPVAGPP